MKFCLECRRVEGKWGETAWKSQELMIAELAIHPTRCFKLNQRWSRERFERGKSPKQNFLLINEFCLECRCVEGKWGETAWKSQEQMIAELAIHPTRCCKLNQRSAHWGAFWARQKPPAFCYNLSISISTPRLYRYTL
jgi:hypothetical protein